LAKLAVQYKPFRRFRFKTTLLKWFYAKFVKKSTLSGTHGADISASSAPARSGKNMKKITKKHKCRDGILRDVEVKPTTKYCPVCNGRFDYKGRETRAEKIEKAIKIINMLPKTRRTVENIAVGLNLSLTSTRELLRIMEAKNMLYSITAQNTQKKFYEPRIKLTEAEKKQIETEARQLIKSGQLKEKQK